MAETRTNLMAKITRHIEALPLPPGVKKLVALNWLVDNDGALVQLRDDTDLADILSQWAPELADTINAVDLRASLLWNSTTGPHGDDLRKWAFKGVLPAQWNRLLEEHGVPKRKANACLLGIEKIVCEVTPELWRVFCEKVHQERCIPLSKTALRQRIADIFSSWDGPVPHGLEADVSKWTPKHQRAWASKITRRRAHNARAHLLQSANQSASNATNQRRITSFYHKQPARPGPIQRGIHKARTLARRGALFSTEAERHSARQRLRQATLRDTGWETTPTTEQPFLLPLLRPEVTQHEALPPLHKRATTFVRTGQ